jgi:hypothetical protein
MSKAVIAVTVLAAGLLVAFLFLHNDRPISVLTPSTVVVGWSLTIFTTVADMHRHPDSSLMLLRLRASICSWLLSSQGRVKVVVFASNETCSFVSAAFVSSPSGVVVCSPLRCFRVCWCFGFSCEVAASRCQRRDQHGANLRLPIRRRARCCDVHCVRVLMMQLSVTAAYMYINSDIVLFPDFFDAVSAVWMTRGLRVITLRLMHCMESQL